jgi:alkanesulfonate monooxygenase SsuD/methylene tetrahydromethanopterin reductase-like flavin-dependent oxidoreductase (luciferase family)
MRIGISPFASTRAGMLAVADAAFAGGIDSFWLGEGLLYVEEFKPWSGGMEPITWLALLAGRHPGARVGVCASVLPLRDVTWLAKQAATLDQLTEGNFVLALTPGMWEREFAFLGLDYNRRGRRLAASLDALEAAFAGRAHSSEVATYPDWGRLSPVPHNGVAPELWLAGGPATTRQALRRGWPVQLQLKPVDQIEAAAADWYARGGKGLALRMPLRLAGSVGSAGSAGSGSGPTGVVDGPYGGYEAVGSPQELAELFAAYERAGIVDLSIIPGQSDQASLAAVEALVETIIPAYHALAA